MTSWTRVKKNENKGEKMMDKPGLADKAKGAALKVAGEVEQACARIDKHLLDTFDVLDEIFIQPVSREDERIRERVRARYGRVMADE